MTGRLMGRNPDEETAITRAATDRQEAAAALSRLAAERARSGPVQVRALVTEAVEELADARNYVIWAIQTDQLAPNTGLDALSHLIYAYIALTEPTEGV